MEEPNPLVHTEVDTALPVSQLLRLPQRPKNLLRVQNRPIGSFYTHPVRRPAFLRSAVLPFPIRDRSGWSEAQAAPRRTPASGQWGG